MSSELNDRLTKDLSEEERFLLKVGAVLDNSLPRTPPALVARLDSARHAAMLQVRDSRGCEVAQQNIVQTLDDSAEHLSPEIKSRLDAIRGLAMQRARESSGGLVRAGRQWQDWFRSLALPASAFASVCVLVITVAVFRQPDPQETMPELVADNALLLASDEDLELYENLEFYQWLADNGLQY
ncbi:MAG: DUF3619 family protein [Pseudomonadales bacterium]|nr:DUF3619 family protein [Pseudomonadales bacterium]